MKIDGYDIETEIHRGSVTSVYLAVQKRLDRKVLLKILNKQWLHSKDLVQRFEREAKICARLKHPNIVNIYDFGSLTDSFYISMEYVDGKNLAVVIQDNEYLPFPEIMNICRQIFFGLLYAHDQGALHRDIKPSNIMLDNEGNVKITDFGLATSSDLPRVTEHGQTVGSAGYMSPEQIMGNTVDVRSDIFSLGCTLYELCTKKSPFYDPNLGTAIQNTLSRTPSRLSDIRSDIPFWFDKMIGKMIARDPENRYASIRDILKEFSDAVNSDGSDDFKRNSVRYAENGNIRPEEHRRKKLGRKVLITGVLFISIAVLAIVWTDRYFPSEPGNTTISEFAEMDNPRMVASSADSANSNLSTTIDRTRESDREKGQFPIKSIEQKPEADNTIETAEQNKQPHEKAGLFVAARPWAAIYIDGVKTDSTPLMRSINVKPGTHKIVLKNPAYHDYSAEVEFMPGKTESLTVELYPSKGYLDLRVNPWAEVYINDNFIETTPFPENLALNAGSHVLKLINPGFRTLIDTIEIKPGKILEKNVKLMK